MKTMCNIRAAGILIFLHLLTTAISASAQHAGPEYVPMTAAERYSRYVMFLPQGKLDSVLVFSDAEPFTVVHRVNRYALEPGERLDSVTFLVDRVLNDPQVRLAYIWVAGSASPEGPRDYNTRLGQLRAEALVNYLRQNTAVTADQFRVEDLGEDWYSVEQTLRRTDFPNRDRILKIISVENNVDKRKKDIWNIDRGHTWHMLINDVFPPCRTSRMMIVCYVDEQPEEIVRIVEVAEEPAPNVIIICPEDESTKPVRAADKDTRFIALKTNAIFWGALVPNLALEVELWPQWSLDIPVYYSPFNISSTRKVRLLATQPELRWWLRDAGEGHFLGLHGHIAGFNVAINDNGRYQDPNRPAWGFGLGYGYAIDFGMRKNWGVEFNIGLGFVNYAYDAYYNRLNGMEYGSGTGYYWGITRAGISFYHKWRIPRK